MSMVDYSEAEILLAHSINVLAQCRRRSAPSVLEALDTGEFTYFRMLDLQLELCESILALCKVDFLRPAHAVLRSVLESSATLCWASQKQRYLDVLNAASLPPMKERLDRIGWGEEYTRSYKWLSDFVHAGMQQADFYRTFEGFDLTQPMPEITPDGEYFVFQHGKIAGGMASEIMSVEQAKSEYMPYLSAKCLDIVLCEIKYLFQRDSNVGAVPWPTDALVTLGQVHTRDAYVRGNLMIFSQP